MNISEFESTIGYTFKNKELLKRALTHSSLLQQAKDRHLKNNERLEFLGDAFLDAIVAVRLCELMPKAPEGVLTKERAKVVCEGSLAEVGNELGLGEYLRLSKGEEASGGREKPAIIADAVEAVIGAIFMDGGYGEADTFVRRIMNGQIQRAVEGKLINDYKTELQERVPPKCQLKLKYSVVGEEGPDHAKTFHVELTYDGHLIGKGSGKSKKEAEMNAAKEAVERGENFVF